MRRAFAIVLLFPLLSVAAEKPKPIKILFLGDKGHHKPAERFRQIQPVLAARGIELEYTERVEALNPKTLAGYDGLLIYANTTAIAGWPVAPSCVVMGLFAGCFHRNIAGHIAHQPRR